MRKWNLHGGPHVGHLVADIKVLSSANPTEASSSAQQIITSADGLITLPSGAMTGKFLTRQILSPK